VEGRPDFQGGAGQRRGGASLKIQGGASLKIQGGASLKIQGGASLKIQVIKGAAQMRVRSDVTR
jgi:hypothetical protein